MMNARALATVAVLLAWTGPELTAAATEPAARTGMVEQPCPAPLPVPASVRNLLVDMFMRPHALGDADFSALMDDKEFAAYNAKMRRRGATDWAGLCRYQAANAAQSPGAAKVIFIGDSITENWLLADPDFFTGAVVNRGIGAQTSAQMLVRFRADVVALRPAVVHILTGTNDVAGNNGPLRPLDFQNNIESMVEIARANEIRVILGSIPPANAFNWQPTLKPAPQIAALNAWLRDYARSRGLAYIDYHRALRGQSGELSSALGNDGVHPNRDGYAVMRRLAEPALANFLRTPSKSP
jgi:lysophospholipase L1-like esterase